MVPSGHWVAGLHTAGARALPGGRGSQWLLLSSSHRGRHGAWSADESRGRGFRVPAVQGGLKLTTTKRHLPASQLCAIWSPAPFLFSLILELSSQPITPSTGQIAGLLLGWACLGRGGCTTGFLPELLRDVSDSNSGLACTRLHLSLLGTKGKDVLFSAQGDSCQEWSNQPDPGTSMRMCC